MAITFPIVRMVIDNQSVEFAGADILECTVLQESHPISIELPISTVDLTVYTNDNRFSIYSDGEFYNSLSKNMPMTVFENVDGVDQFIGKFYIDKWDAPTENTLHFELIDAVGLLDSIEYPGFFWEVDTPLPTVVADILTNTSVVGTFDADTENRTVKGWIPPGTAREALHQVCFAARSMVVTNASSLFELFIKNASLPEQNPVIAYPSITDADKTNEQRVVHKSLITNIAVKSHDYYNLGVVGQTAEEIYNAWLEPGNYIIPYQKPYWSVWGEGVGAIPIFIATEDGRVIATEDSGTTWATARIATESETFEFHSNYVSVVVRVAGQITIWGYPWLVNERHHRYSVTSESEKNEIVIDDAMLVNSTSAEVVLNKVVEYFNLRYEKEVTLFPRQILPGTLYSVASYRAKMLLCITEKLQSDLTGGFLTNAAFTGMEKSVSGESI